MALAPVAADTLVDPVESPREQQHRLQQEEGGANVAAEPGGGDDVAGSGEQVQNSIVAVEQVSEVYKYEVTDADAKLVMDAMETSDIPQKIRTKLYSAIRRAFAAAEDGKVYMLAAVIARYADETSKRGMRFFLFRYQL